MHLFPIPMPFPQTSFKLKHIIILNVYRLFKFQLEQAGRKPFELRFIKCSFEEDHRPFKFGTNGVMSTY